MKRRIEAVAESYTDELRLIRDGLRSALTTADNDLQTAIKPPLKTLDDIIERRDVSGIPALLPFVNWLHANQDHPIAGVLGDTAAQGTLNYLIDGIFSAEMLGAPDAVDEHKMEAMLRFYAGNPAQTSEGSWQANNTMLFVFGDRVVDCLASKAPDRVAAFYQAVLDARKIAPLGPGPDEEAIPEDELPTAEQLRDYEAAFGRLEMLASKGVLPKADPTEAGGTEKAQVPSPVQQPTPKKPTEQKPVSSTPAEESPVST